MTRYKQAVSETPEVVALVRDVTKWAKDWIDKVSRDSLSFTDSINRMSKDASSVLLRDLERRLEQVTQIIDRNTRPRTVAAPIPRHAMHNEGVLAALQAHYVGPGDERAEGPRHDNDFVDIGKIRIAPTHQELVSRVAPFLPANIPQAPHPFPAESMERLLDIQFRLLREELT